jgi:hypothetical protein
MTDIDRRLRDSNFIPDDQQPPVSLDVLMARAAEAERPATPQRRWRHPIAIAATTLALAGTATAAVVVSATGPSTDIEQKATATNPAAARITALMNAGTSRDASAQERAAAPELGDAGPVKALTVNRAGFAIDVVTDSKKLCVSAHAASSVPTGNVNCTTLPLRYDMIPLYGTSDGPESHTRLEVAVAPDGVRDFRVRTDAGRNVAAEFDDNIAALTYPGTESVVSWTWTTPDGQTVTQRRP